MKERKKRKEITYAWIVLYIITIFLFIRFGGAIRNVLSPTVLCESAKSIIYDGKIYAELPQSAEIVFMDCKSYLWAVYPDKTYREDSYIVRLCEIEIIEVQEKKCIAMQAGFDRIVTQASKALTDGGRVNLKTENRSQL
ncbi:MAG: hypothetical protein ACI4SJ_01365 [Candidatus Avispirillum sp.]